MDIIDKQRNKIIGRVLFILYPILYLPSIVLGIYNKKKCALFYLSIFLGLIAYLYPPTGDLYRGAMEYYEYGNLNWIQLTQELEGKFDFLLSIFMWLLSKLNFPPDVARLVYVVVGSYIIFLLFDDIAQKRCFSKKLYIILFVCILLIVRYSYFMYRFGFSLSLFTYGVYLYINNKRKIHAFIFFIVAILNHFSYSIFVLLFFFSMFLKYNGNRNLALAFFIGSFIFSGDIVSNIIRVLPVDVTIVNHLLIYTDGYYGGEYMTNHSFNYFLLTKLSQCNYVVLFILFFQLYKPSIYAGWITILLFINLLISPFPAASGRIEIIVVFTTLIYILNNIDSYLCLKTKKNIKFLLFTGCFYTLICTWSIRRELSISNEYKLLLPTLFIFSSSYDYQWMHENVNFDGSPILK